MGLRVSKSEKLSFIKDAKSCQLGVHFRRRTVHAALTVCPFQQVTLFRCKQRHISHLRVFCLKFNF